MPQSGSSDAASRRLPFVSPTLKAGGRGPERLLSRPWSRTRISERQDVPLGTSEGSGAAVSPRRPRALVPGTRAPHAGLQMRAGGAERPTRSLRVAPGSAGPALRVWMDVTLVDGCQPGAQRSPPSASFAVCSPPAAVRGPLDPARPRPRPLLGRRSCFLRPSVHLARPPPSANAVPRTREATGQALSEVAARLAISTCPVPTPERAPHPSSSPPPRSHSPARHWWPPPDADTASELHATRARPRRRNLDRTPPWSLWSPAFHPPSAPHGASPEAPGSGAGAWVLQLALRNGVPAALPLPEAGVRQDGAVDSSLQTEPCGEEARPVECRSRQPLLWVLSLDLHPIPTCLTHRGRP